MPLTTVVGSSGSGKTTFLNDLNEHSKCIYIRQYHTIRPYVTVSKIPHFDPTKLPYWDVYEKEGKSASLVVGGTMAGEFIAGLSGGQRKILLFELIVQRATQSGQQLLIVLDEPFAGVTDDFVPWIVEQLDYLRNQKHNIVLVTNDHVHTLMELADNIISVSAVDRSIVKINQSHTSDRQMVLHVLGSVGVDYNYPKARQSDLNFFLQVEIIASKSLMGIAAFTMFLYGLFLLTFWNSQPSSAALILIAADIVSFFSVNPYLLSLVDWRNAMAEEAEALVHSSKSVNKFLKTLLCTLLLLCISAVEYGMINAVVEGLESPHFLVAIFFDLCSTTLPYVVFGLYTMFPNQLCQVLAILPFLFLLLFSTTFSPGAGLPVIKELRYLFTRFYMFCMVPGVQDYMEGCPKSQAVNLSLLCLTGLLTVLLFVAYVAMKGCLRSTKKAKVLELRGTLQGDENFQALKEELLGESSNKTVRRSFAQLKECPKARSLKSSSSAPSSYDEKKQHMTSPIITEVIC